MELVKLTYEALEGLSELKSLLLNAQEYKEECKRVYPTLKSFIRRLKIKINEIENLIEKYCNDDIENLIRIIYNDEKEE